MQETSNNSNYNYFLSYAKGLAAIFVVLIHLAPMSLAFENIYLCLTIYSAVPVFLMIACMNWGNSYRRLEENKPSKNLSLKEMYSPKLYIKRFSRLLVPFIIFFIIEELFFIKGNQTVGQVITDFLYGGVGAGRNMLPLLLEILIFYPLLYKFIKKSNTSGLLILILINLLFEYYIAGFDVQRKYYMVNALRFLTSSAFGTYICFNDLKIKNSYVLGFGVIGVWYIISIYILQAPIYPFVKHSTQCLMVQLYYFAVFYALYRLWKNSKIPGIAGNIADIIGKSSWHIFLVQILYFFGIQWYVSMFVHKNILLYFSLSVFVCVITGVIFWYTEDRCRYLCARFILNKKEG